MLAQHPITATLFQLLNSGNFDEAKKSLDKYSVESLAALPDSTLFDYYYLRAFIHQHDRNEKGMQQYLVAAKDLCEQSLGIHSPVYLELCWALGNSLEATGDTISAFEIFQAALVQSIGLYSLDDEDVKWQYQEINNKVIDWYKDDNIRTRMIQHREQLPPRDVSKDAIQNDMEFYVQFYHDEIAKATLTTADSLLDAGEWQDASRIYIDLASKTQNNPIAKATLQQLGALCLINIEDYQQAELLLLDNLDLLNDYKQSKVYRKTLSQLSNLYNAIHNYTRAREYASAAKRRYEMALDFSRAYILCLHRCANFELGSGNNFLALVLEDVALQELYKNQTFGVISGASTSREDFLANCLSAAALYYNQFGHYFPGFYDNAFMNIERAIEIAEANGLDASTYYGNLADICLATKDFDRALEAIHKSYEISDNERNKIQIGTTICLTQFYARKPISQDVLSETCGLLQSYVKKIFSFASTDQRREFWKTSGVYVPILNFLAYQTDQRLYGAIYNNILMEKGLLLRTSNSLRDEIYNSGNSNDIGQYETMLQLRESLPSLSSKEAIKARKEMERIDKHLTQQYSSYADYAVSNEVSWDVIQDNLSEEDIAIEFYNIPSFRWLDDGSDVDATPRYCAITLKKGYEAPHIVPLFNEKRLGDFDNVDYYETDSIYNLLWKPLEGELKGVKNIYFAADRELHKIAIEYAPMSDGQIIGDCYNIHRLSSTRVLADRRAESKTDKAVLYGGLRYDMKKDDLVAESRSGDYHPVSASRALTDDNLRYGVKYLPGTLKEVEDISGNFSKAPIVITDIKGTEESFKALAGSSVDIIHLATHGFFWSNETAQKRDYVTFLKSNNEQQSSEDYALLRSGLFFSGANIGLMGEPLPDDVEDGVLTALELSNMNLGNVDMVVMSACESGLGETSGEGVFGLQRGFKLAGANTLLMSLWKVDDTATQLMMTEFYRNYLSGKTKQESLRLARQYLRNYTNGDEDYSDPKFWAAFILLDALN